MTLSVNLMLFQPTVECHKKVFGYTANLCSEGKLQTWKMYLVASPGKIGYRSFAPKCKLGGFPCFLNNREIAIRCLLIVLLDNF